MTYNYMEAVKNDVLENIGYYFSLEEIAAKLHEDRDDFAEELNDLFWIDDSVTGNASGSYTFNRAQAREYVTGDMDTVAEAIREFCMESETIADHFLCEDWEYFDVTARCYCLYSAIDTALDEMEEDPETQAAIEALENAEDLESA